MQSKQVAVAGILTGAVMTGLGVVALVAGLAEAERPDHDPATGYQDVGNTYPDVDPLPPLPGSKLSEEPSADASARPRGAAANHDGATYEPVVTEPAKPVGDPDRPQASREPDEPVRTGGSTPTPDPTPTAEPEPDPEPSVEPTESADPTTDPTPTETATPPTEP